MRFAVWGVALLGWAMLAPSVGAQCPSCGPAAGGYGPRGGTGYPFTGATYYPGYIPGHFCNPAGIPAPGMNPHAPFYIATSAAYWGGYGIAGPTDRVPCCPVNGIGAPPFGPPPYWGGGQQAMFRSPRDYFMFQP